MEASAVSEDEDDDEVAGSRKRSPLGLGERDAGPSQLRLDGFDDASGDPDRDTWTTPAFITDAIGPVDLDPCSNERSKVQAARVFRLDRGQDGLALARYVGRDVLAFCNPPYSRGQVVQWVRAYRHCRFLFILRLDTSTKWFAELMEKTEAICVLREQRLNFDPPPGASSSSNAFPHGIFAARESDVSAALRKLCYVWRNTP
jgi:hypothetical protein